MGDTVYPTFAEALNYWTEGTTLTLLGDVSYTGIPSLSDNGMKLHLNGYMLTLNSFNSNIPRIEVGILTLTGGSRGEIQLYSDASVILNTQPNGIWRMNKEGGGTVAVPGQGITLDVASFASATPGYKVSKAENGSIELVTCDHADGEIS